MCKEQTHPDSGSDDNSKRSLARSQVPSTRVYACMDRSVSIDVAMRQPEAACMEWSVLGRIGFFRFFMLFPLTKWLYSKCINVVFFSEQIVSRHGIIPTCMLLGFSDSFLLPHGLPFARTTFCFEMPSLGFIYLSVHKSRLVVQNKFDSFPKYVES